MTGRNRAQTTPYEHYLPVPGARLYVREVGAGPSLIVVHGGPDFNHRYLLPDLDRLSAKFRLVYYDQRGRGRSSAGVSPEDVTIVSEVEDLDRVRQHTRQSKVTLLGHSWGCVIAAEYAVRFPDQVGGLILLNSAPLSHADLQRFRSYRQRREAENLTQARAVASSLPYQQGDIAAETEYNKAHFANAFHRRALVDDFVADLRADFQPSDIIKARAIEMRLYAETWNQLDYDLPAALKELRVPMLVIHGVDDFIPEACARHVAEAVPGARLLVLPECGHFAFIERPDALMNAIVEIFGAH
jgi:proline iminopeptidase